MTLLSEMSISSRAGEVGQLPNITVRPPRAINHILDLY